MTKPFNTQHKIVRVDGMLPPNALGMFEILCKLFIPKHIHPYNGYTFPNKMDIILQNVDNN